VGELLVALAVLGGILGLVLLGTGFFVLRRYLLLRSIGVFDCALRRDNGRRQGAWAPGMARYESDRLDWFPVFTLTFRPERSLARARLVILDRSDPEGLDAVAVMPGAIVVRCAYGAATLELAMNPLSYDGFATWLESAPPGRNDLLI